VEGILRIYLVKFNDFFLKNFVGEGGRERGSGGVDSPFSLNILLKNVLA
jgi:hypothetical protein